MPRAVQGPSCLINTIRYHRSLDLHVWIGVCVPSFGVSFIPTSQYKTLESVICYSKFSTHPYQMHIDWQLNNPPIPLRTI